jgi:hypothetical protein
MAQQASRPLTFDKVNGDADMQTLSDRHGSQFLKSEAMVAERFESHDEGWRTLWLAIAGVMAITLTWNVLMVSLNGISY